MLQRSLRHTTLRVPFFPSEDGLRQKIFLVAIGYLTGVAFCVEGRMGR